MKNKSAKWLWAILFSTTAIGHAQEAIPDFYKEPGIQPNRAFVNQSQNENIDPFTGALQRHYIDLRIPGNGGMDLTIVRSYNSSSVDPANPTQPRMSAGLGWTLHFGRILKSRNSYPCLNQNLESVSDNPILELPDGSRQLLTFTGQNSPLMITTQRWKAMCSTSGIGLVVTSPDGMVYDMTQALGSGSTANPMYEWHTKKITDRNGNYININYASASSAEIRSISTSDGRSASFTYIDSGKTTARISSITSAGQTYDYSYKPSGIAGVYQLSTVTRPDNATWEYDYSENNGASAGSYLMRSATTPQGGSITYTYDFVFFDSQSNPASKSNVVSKKSMSTGGIWSFDYSPGGNSSLDTTRVTSPEGTTTYKHVGPNYAGAGSIWKVGLLIQKRIGDEQTEQYTWSGQRISTETYVRPGAFVTRFDYLETNAPLLTRKTITRDGGSYDTAYSNFDSYGNPRTITESGTRGGDRTTTVSYYTNTSKWIIRQPQNETSSGHTITRDFDSSGNMTNETKNGISISRTYDSAGNVSSATFPRSLTHNYSNYSRGVAQNESQPEGISITREVSSAGNVTSETIGGETTRYGYDSMNRITSVDYPEGNNVNISYTSRSRTAIRGSLTETINYNSFGRVFSVTRGGISTSYSTDALGRTTFISNPGSSSGTSYSYDILDRVTQIRNPDGTSKFINYGSASKSVRDENGNTTINYYRAYGDPDKKFLMAITAPDSSASMDYDRNSKDLITSAKQAGITRHYSYNSSGYMISATHPETGTTSYGRDAAGNMTSKNVGSSGTTTYSYDSQNRLRTINYTGATPSVTHTYDDRHRLLRTFSTDATRSFSYDGNGNLQSETLNANGMTWTARYGYNENDHLTSITYPFSGEIVRYGVDALGRPTSVSGYITSVSYWPSGQVNRITYANGVSSEYSQNSRLWPSSFSTVRSSTPYSRSSLSYDGVGNLTGISDSIDNAYDRTFGYDNLDRLTSLRTPQGSGSISYDGAGNITSQTIPGLRLSYHYDSSNLLSSMTATPGNTANHSYDAMGNIIVRGPRTFEYDSVPNLKCINCSTAATRVQYAYDGDQKRTQVIQGGITTHEFHGAHGNLLADYSPSSRRLVQYIYLNGKRIAQKESAQ